MKPNAYFPPFDTPNGVIAGGLKTELIISRPFKEFPGFYIKVHLRGI
jgi:hypothetical protein